MDNIVDIIDEVKEPVIETLLEWGEDIKDSVRTHAPQYLRYAIYELKNIHF